jgi:hypothetical protein
VRARSGWRRSVAIHELIFGIKAERQSLEDIAAPLTAEDAGSGSGAAAAPAMA